MSRQESAREYRRRRAIELLDEGEPIDRVARFVEVTAVTLRRWRREGPSTGSQKNTGGRPRKLSGSQLEQLEELLLQGATAHGWPNNLWTGRRVYEMIRRHFNVDFHPFHIYRILKNYLGWTSQKPVNRIRERNEAEIEQWKNETITRLEQEACSRQAYLIFIDESGFMLEPTARHSFAPRGKTPVNMISDPHGRISVIGAISMSPKRRHLAFQYQMLSNNANFHGADVVSFIRDLEKRIATPMTLIWDSIPIHRAKNVYEHIASRGSLYAYAFPPYASELNPVDGVWAYVKYGRLANFAPPSLSELRSRLRCEFDCLQQRRNVLEHCIRRTGLALAGFI